MMTVLEYWWDCVQARLRGERRVAPRDVKGRVYEKHETFLAAIPGLIATGKFKGFIKPTGLYVAAEDKWYDIDEQGNRTPRRRS